MRLDIVLVNYFEEHVHYLTFDVRAHLHKLAVDSVQRRLEEVPLPGVLGVKQTQEVRDEPLVNKLLCQTWLKVTGF